MMILMRNVYDGDDDADAGGYGHNTKVMGMSIMTFSSKMEGIRS